MTLTDLKTATLKHVTAEWVRDTFGDLRRRDTWEAAHDRCSEFIAAKADQAVEAANEIIETVALLTDNCDGLPVAVCEIAQAAFVWVLSQFIVACLFCFEMGKTGAIDELMADVERLQRQKEARALSFLDGRLAASIRIAA
jgi:hypothetical protein